MAKAIGKVSWMDLTIPNALEVKDFYKEVTGWGVQDIDMGGYSDFCMAAPGEDAPIAGICNARGSNANLPPVWLIYVNVEDLDHSMEKCRELGGEVIGEPRTYAGQGRFCTIKDPAGAYLALYQSTVKE